MLAAALDLRGEGEVAVGEDADEGFGEKSRRVFQVRFAADAVIILAAQFQPEIAPVLALAAFAFGCEIVHAARQGDVEDVALGELQGDGLRVAQVGCVGVKGGGGGVGEVAGGDDARGAPGLMSQLEDGRERFASRVGGNGPVVPLHPGGERGGGGGGVWHGVVVGAVAQEGEMGEGFDGQTGVCPSLVKPGGGERVGGEAVGDKEDDSKGLLHHPGVVEQKAEPDEHQQAEEGEKLIA